MDDRMELVAIALAIQGAGLLIVAAGCLWNFRRLTEIRRVAPWLQPKTEPRRPFYSYPMPQLIDGGMEEFEQTFSPEALRVIREISEDQNRRAARYLEEEVARRKQSVQP
jgi:hypothetical protein